MTVSSQTSKVIVNGDDSATTFSFDPIVIQEASHLAVIHVDEDGNQTDLVLNVDYSVDIDEDDYPATGEITYPLSGSPLAEEESLIMLRNVPITQLTDLENQGGYFPDTQEQALDKLTMLIQQLDEVLDRCVRFVPTIELNNVSVELPEPEASAILGWNSDADAIINYTGLQGEQGPQGEQGIQGPAGAGTGDMLAANNLSDVANAATARTNLGVYSTTEIDTLFEDSTPIGTIHLWPTASPPSGWLSCDGTLKSRAAFADLFAVIGETFGAGDGVTTFALPNFSGRFPIGVGTGSTAEGGGTGTARSLAGAGGKESHTLTTSEIPLHGHPYRASYTSQSTARTATTGGLMTYTGGVSTQSAYTGTPANNQGQQIGGSGGGQTHTIMPPFLGIYFIIKAE
jgi:microcystin-dependent protein